MREISQVWLDRSKPISGDPNVRNDKSVGQKFWARGYFVSTVGADEKVIKAYIQNQERDDKKLEELSLFNRQ